MASTAPAPAAATVKLEQIALLLRHVFTISRSSEDVAKSLVLRLSVDGIEALGESAPSGRYGESVEAVAQQLSAVDLRGVDLWAIDAVLGRLPAAARGAMCALDLALHDLAGKRLGVPLHRLFGLDPAQAKPTSFTIGLADVETMVQKTREAGRMPILKVKLGIGDDIEIISALRSAYAGTIRIDANEAWTPERAVRLLKELHRFDVEFCEQPVKAGQPDALRYVRERSPIPIVADEDCRTLADVARLQGCVDGINIKLVKCGGLREALRMIHAARALDMKVMIGCMIESSVLSTAAAHLTPLVDWADLDGPLLVTNDPFEGVRYEGAQLRLPSQAGLGVRPRVAA